MSKDSGSKWTPKKEQFCHAYMARGCNATKAAIDAGYSEKTAYSQGQRLLKDVEVQNRVAELQSDLEKAAGINAYMLVKEHMKIAFSNSCQLRKDWMDMEDFKKLSEDVKATIQEIQTKEVVKTFKGVKTKQTLVRVKTYDKQRSLEALANMIGANAPTKSEITGADGANLFLGLMKAANGK